MRYTVSTSPVLQSLSRVPSARALFGAAILGSIVLCSVLSGCGGAEVIEDAAADTDPEGRYEEGPVGKADYGAENAAAYAKLPKDADLSAPFEAMFCPDDPTVSVELALLDHVIAARKADAGSYQEGSNPYRVRYAVYNIGQEDIVRRLVDAHKAGVDVQVLMEDHQLDPAKDWNTTDELLVKHGFEYAPDHRALDDRGRRTADLVGIVDEGLMHLKTRIFETPKDAVVLSGSMNPGNGAVLNEETLHIIREPYLVERYVAGYQAVLEGRWHDNVWDDGRAVNVLHTPSQSGPTAGTKILQWIAEEDEQILLMVFSLRKIYAEGVNGNLVSILAQKKAAGVPVFVITDRKQSDGVDADGKPLYFDDLTDDKLREAGIPVYEALNLASPYTAMHHKVGILGRTRVRVITDAANWTKAALGSDRVPPKNVESVLFIDSDELDGGRTGRRYLAQWLRVLGRYAHQSVDKEGEQPYEKVAEQLLRQPGWPGEQVSFVAHDAKTSVGEHIAVVGDLPELGRWGKDSGGVALWTDAGTYPTWQAYEPLPMQLGVRFSWKLVQVDEDGDMVGWEAGDNRKAIVQPQVLVRKEWIVFEGTWQR